VLIVATAAAAAGQIPGLGDPGEGRYDWSVSLDMLGYGTADVQDQLTDLEMSVGSVSLRGPIYRRPMSRWVWGLRGHRRHNETDALLPDSGEELPEDLYDVSGNFGYLRFWRGGRMFGAFARVGSSSNEPFDTFDETALGLFGFYRLPTHKKDAWLFLVFFSNNRPLLNYVPIPGVAYQWRRKHVDFTLGIPFANLTWRPTKRWQVRAMVNPSPGGLLHVGYRPVLGTPPADKPSPGAPKPNEGLRLLVYAEARTERDGYFRANRDERFDTLFYLENRVEVGLRAGFGPNVSLDLAAGRALDRFYFEGEDYDERNDNRIDIEDAGYLSLSLKAQF
jgi:hypothetical protein